MKKITLLLIFIISVSFCFGQGISFKCGGYSFTVYEDETPLEYNFKAGDRMSYDYKDRISKIGDLYVSYDYKGRVSKIGNVGISYDYRGKISWIGNMSISYDYKGRLTGSSGSVGCRW